MGVDENLALSVQSEPRHLAEEDGVVAVADRDQVVLPHGVVSTALALELELHGEAESLLHLDAVLAAAGWLGEVGGGVAGAGDGPTDAVDLHQGQVDGGLLATSTGLILYINTFLLVSFSRRATIFTG